MAIKIGVHFLERGAESVEADMEKTALVEIEIKPGTGLILDVHP